MAKINHDQMLENMKTELIAIFSSVGTAADALETAKEGKAAAADMAIRKFATSQIAKTNIDLSDKEILALADDVAKAAYPNSVAARKSELAVLFGLPQKKSEGSFHPRMVATIIADLDKFRKNNPEVNFHLREATIKAARHLRDVDGATVAKAIESLNLIKKPLSDEEQFRALMKRTRTSPLVQDSIGDEKMIKRGIEQRLSEIEAHILDGTPLPEIEDSKEYKALEAQLDGLKAQIASTRGIIDSAVGEEVPFANAIDEALAEATIEITPGKNPDRNPDGTWKDLGGTQDGDEPGVVLGTGDTEEAAPVSAEALLGAKKKASKSSYAGVDDIDELMGLAGIMPSSKKTD